jgi:curved DNA-binding protein CbpA
MTHDLPDYYAVLGVASTASPAEIAHAYRCQVRSQHPDTGHDQQPDGLSAVLAAYAVLRDPARRAAYDQQRQSTTTITTDITSAPSSAPSAPPVAPPGRARPLLRVGPVRYHGPTHRGHE